MKGLYVYRDACTKKAKVRNENEIKKGSKERGKQRINDRETQNGIGARK